MTSAEPRKEPEMRRIFGSRIVARSYARTPGGRLLLKAYVRAEGGQMFSLSLRDILFKAHGVLVGDFSYGSLLVPGYADAGTVIGRYVSIGPNVRRIGAAHPIDAPSMHPFWYNPALKMVDASADVQRTGCSIGHDSWIGANTTILPGCSRIGNGAIVGAGSVVTRDVPDFAIVAGNPARLLRQRFRPDVAVRISNAQPWNRSPYEAKSILDELSSLTIESNEEPLDAAEAPRGG